MTDSLLSTLVKLADSGAVAWYVYLGVTTAATMLGSLVSGAVTCWGVYWVHKTVGEIAASVRKDKP